MPPAQTKKGIYPMEKEITVQELIDQLNKIENKSLPVDCTVGMKNGKNGVILWNSI